MKKLLLMLVIVAVQLGAFAQTHRYTVNILNTGTNSIFSGGDVLIQPVYSGLALSPTTIETPPTSPWNSGTTETIVFDYDPVCTPNDTPNFAIRGCGASLLFVSATHDSSLDAGGCNGFQIVYSGTIDWDSCTTPSLSTTNYTFTLRNSMSVAGVAVWKWNGSTVKTEILQPGQSDTWTSPTVEIAPTPDNFSFNGSVSPVQAQTSVGDDGSGNPVITFNNGGGGSPISGTVSGSGNPTNGDPSVPITATNQPVLAPTNIVTFAPSTGNPAQEPTLQSGFQLLHSDNDSLLNGLSVINSSIQAQTAWITNGDGVIEELQRSNNDAMWQLVRTMTNLNLAVSTNTLQLTNYATETTLAGISNSFFGNYTGDLSATNSWGSDFLTNDFAGQFSALASPMTNLQVYYPYATNYSQADDATAGTTQGAESALTGWLSGFSDFSGGMDDYYPPVDMTLTITY